MTSAFAKLNGRNLGGSRIELSLSTSGHENDRALFREQLRSGLSDSAGTASY
jgi:hypothetical protein